MPYTWVTSYVAGDKIYCLHEAEDVETILEHARRGGFPADLVSVVANEFGPQTAEQCRSGDRTSHRVRGGGRPVHRPVARPLPTSSSARPSGPTVARGLLERERELRAAPQAPRRGVAGARLRRRGQR